MEHLPVRLSTLRGGQKISFDLYIQLHEKYVLYIRKGDSFEGTRLKRLKEKKLSKLHILKSEETFYRDYIARNIENAYSKKPGQNVEDQSQIVHGLQQAATDQFLENPTEKNAYDEIKAESARFVEFLSREDQTIKHLLASENADKSLSHHGVNVATYSLAIAKACGISDSPTLSLLSLGAMIHDIGHFKIGEKNDVEEYKKHPAAGANWVKDLAHLDPQIAHIIHQHEETIDGSGFPNGLREKAIHPLAQIVSSANAIDRMISFQQVPAEEAAKKFLQECVGKYPLHHIKAVQGLLK